MSGHRHDGNPEGNPLAVTQAPAFSPRAHVWDLPRSSVFCEFCHRVGRVKAALEAQRGLSPECHISASKMLNPSMCHLLWLRARLCQLPSGVCDRDWVGGAASSAAATAQEWGTAQYHCIALVLCRRTEGSSFQQGHTGTHSCVAVPGRESKAWGTCKWKNIHCMGERQHRG